MNALYLSNYCQKKEKKALLICCHHSFCCYLSERLTVAVIREQIHCDNLLISLLPKTLLYLSFTSTISVFVWFDLVWFYSLCNRQRSMNVTITLISLCQFDSIKAYKLSSDDNSHRTGQLPMFYLQFVMHFCKKKKGIRH